MEKKLFLNKDVAKIIGITKRQVQHWTDKGLVEPAREAQNPGANRGYDYTNLLEFGLCKELFEMGMGVYAVKRMLKDLRAFGEIRAWAENYRNFFLKKAKEFKEVNRRIPKEFIPNLKGTILDPKILENEEALAELLKPQKKPIGILFYFFEKEKRYMSIIPFEIEYVLKLNETKDRIKKSERVIIINLGKIKRKVDKNANKAI